MRKLKWLQIIKYPNMRNKNRKQSRPSKNPYHGAVTRVVNINHRQLSNFKESAQKPLAEFHLLSDELKWRVRGRNRTQQGKNICSSKSC